MDDKNLQQEPQEEENDSFLDEWEDDEPVREETDPGGDGGKTAPAQENGQSAEGGDGGPGGILGPVARSRVQSDVRAFTAAFPEAARNFRDIPPEVWSAVKGGASLTAAYAQYSGARAAARVHAEEAVRRRARQDAWNAAASTGSMKSAGSPRRKDPFLEGWEEG